MKKYACPALVTGMETAMDGALVAIGWTFGVPKCVTDAVKKGCESLVDKAFKRRMIVAPRRLKLPDSVKSAILKGGSAVVDVVVDCIAAEAKKLSSDKLKLIPSI